VVVAGGVVEVATVVVNTLVSSGSIKSKSHSNNSRHLARRLCGSLSASLPVTSTAFLKKIIVVNFCSPFITFVLIRNKQIRELRKLEKVTMLMSFPFILKIISLM
jgi:hypothetical protein